MARPSEFFFDSAKSLWEVFGWGNIRLLLPFLALATFSGLLLAGYFFPAFATASEWIFGTSIFMSVFAGISIIGELGLGAIVVGAILGIAAAALGIALCSVALYVAPVLTALLVLPNVLALTCGVLGGIWKIPEAIFDCLYNCFCCCSKSDSAKYDSPKQPGPKTGAASAHAHQTTGAQVHHGLASATGQYQYGSRESDEFMSLLDSTAHQSSKASSHYNFGSSKGYVFHQSYGAPASATVAASAAGNGQRRQFG